MTKTLESLKRVMDDIEARSVHAHFDSLLDELTKNRLSMIHRAKADAVYEVGVKLLSVRELNLLMKHRDNLSLHLY